MSQVYATEPPTSGRVVLETTHGPLDVQLWCHECPLTTRLFLQLCMDGFYDNMVFHRIVPDFLIQTGIMRITTKKQQQQHSAAAAASSSNNMDGRYREAVHAQEALDRRRYELHSRLRFNHRGQVAMALGVDNDDNDDEEEHEMQPQFFVTLDEAPYLDGKHVVFGTITGPTMFNAIRMGKTTDVNESTNQPNDVEHAPRILSVKIVDNPIHTDLVPQRHVPWKKIVEKDEENDSLLVRKKKKKKRKGKKDLNVLSFGNEMKEQEDGALDDSGGVGGGGMKSSHDVVTSQVLSNQVDDKVQEAVDTAGSTRVAAELSMSRKREEDEMETLSRSQPATAPDTDDNEEATDSKNLSSESAEKMSRLTQQEPPKGASEPTVESTHTQPTTKTGRSVVESRLEKYKNLKASSSKKQREEDTMAKLVAFKGKVRKQVTNRNESTGDRPTDNDLAARMARKQEKAERQGAREQWNKAPTCRGQVLEISDEDEEQKNSWLSTTFKCRKHMDIDSAEGGTELAADGRAMDDYRVVDEKHHGRHRDRKRRKHGSDQRGHEGRRRWQDR